MARKSMEFRAAFQPERSGFATALLFAALAVGGCETDEALVMNGVDITLTDVAPDAGAMAEPKPALGRNEPLPNDRWPRVHSRPNFDDQTLIAGPSHAVASRSDPHAAKRQFFVAWLRVSMPTAGPGERGTVSAVFTPAPADSGEYWKISEGQVLCNKGKPSVRGAALHDVDCGVE